MYRYEHVLRICSIFAMQQSCRKPSFRRCIVVSDFVCDNSNIRRKLLVNFRHLRQYKNSLTKRGGGYSIKESVCAKSRRSIFYYTII